MFEIGPKRQQMFDPIPNIPFVCLVKTAQGDCLFSPTWPHADVLRARIAERAVDARASRWGVLGARPELDWPKTFGYDNAVSKWSVAAIRIACYVLMVASFAYFGPYAWRNALAIASLMGCGWGSLPLIGKAAYILFFLGVPLFSLPGFGELRRQQAQSITLSQDGILYSDANRKIQARWDEITRLTVGATDQSATVEAVNGTFDFWATISDYRVIKSALETMTSESVPAGWEPKTKNRINITPRRSEVIQASDQLRMFSYRTRTTRALLLLGTVYFGGFMAVFGVLCLSEIHSVETFVAMFREAGKWGGSLIGGILYLLIGFLFTAWNLRSYFVAGIRTDDEGITQLTAFGPKRILWSDVTDVKSVGAEALTWVSVFSPKQRIWFSPLIADSKQLLAEIKRRTQKEPEIS